MTQEHQGPTKDRSAWWYVVMVGALFALLVVTASLFFRDFTDFRSEGRLAFQRRIRGTIGSASATPDVASIADWMTFDYLDRVFRLPPAYLQDALGITDARYPRISIRRWARDAKIDPAAALGRVQDALRARATSK